jgi:hypothetical protein
MYVHVHVHVGASVIRNRKTDREGGGYEEAVYKDLFPFFF